MANGIWSSSRAICVIGALAFALASVCVRSSPPPFDGRLGSRQRIAGAQNNVQLQNLAKFAVAQYNAKQNAGLVYVRLVSADRQVVEGTMYYLVLEATAQNGVSKLYEAQVWVKPWQNFKSLQDFREKPAAPGVRPHVETMNPDGMLTIGNGDVSMQPVSSNDALVKEAAEQALKTLQARSNSLAPYQLKKVVSVHAQLQGKSTSYDLVLITRRGTKEEGIDATVVRTSKGAWIVKDVHLHH